MFLNTPSAALARLAGTSRDFESRRAVSVDVGDTCGAGVWGVDGVDRGGAQRADFDSLAALTGGRSSSGGRFDNI